MKRTRGLVERANAAHAVQHAIKHHVLSTLQQGALHWHDAIALDALATSAHL
jgi:hypothetical protein